MVYPKRLQEGDTVGLVAPASPITEERIALCVKALESLGLKVKVGQALARSGQIFQELEEEKKRREGADRIQAKETKAEVAGTEGALVEETEQEGAALERTEREGAAADGRLASWRQEDGVKGFLETGYLAGRPEDRAGDISQMFADPKIKGVICAKGGYGSAQIMGYLDQETIRKNPKLFLGFSDITNLLATLSQRWGIVAYHGPMPSSNMIDPPMDPYTAACLKEAIFTDWQELDFKNPEGKALETLSGGKASGRLTGGNVTVFARMTGTFYQTDTKDKILFLEDVTEQVPSIDMYITQMENAGLFKGVKGILLGDFNGCEDRYCSAYPVEELLRDRFGAMGIPVLSGLGCGHRRTTATLPMGAWCEMDADRQSVRFLRW